MVFFKELTLKLKSLIFSRGAILFHRLLDLDTKLSAGGPVRIIVSFRVEILKWLWRDIGLLSLSILETSIRVW